MRSEREYLPYSIELLDVENEFYQGTEIPFNFESDIVLNMEGNQSRRALVYMNTPLRHDGKTFYQYQMNAAADYTVFQVIRNPSWLIPYIACVLVSIGLLWQFSFHLVRFLRKTLTLSNLHERRKYQKTDEGKNRTGNSHSLGVYFSFLPNRFATSSIIDFVKGDRKHPRNLSTLRGFRDPRTTGWQG